MMQINSNNINRNNLNSKIEDTINNMKTQNFDYRKIREIEEVVMAVKLSKMANKKIYIVNDFLKYNGEEFIRNVYIGILKREIEPVALESLLNILYSGKRTKMDILLSVRYSKEGRLKSVNLLGAKKRYLISLLKRTPILGYTLQTLYNLVRIPHLIKRLNSLETSLNNKVNISSNQIEIFDKEEKEHILDAFYLSFEERFRGERSSIKERQKFYLPIVQNIIKDSSQSLLDIGCGRGEWIELLKENSIKAIGIDLNRLMVQTALDFGLDAIKGDAISYLKNQEDESIDVITGFHIVEHLAFKTLISLFDESLRVLKKGGIIIFETPNPENIIVGSCSFYTDPTHINPIPPVTLEFMAINRGFKNIEIHRLHPVKEVTLSSDIDEDINNLIYSSTKEQDYSIIGTK